MCQLGANRATIIVATTKGTQQNTQTETLEGNLMQSICNGLSLRDFVSKKLLADDYLFAHMA